MKRSWSLWAGEQCLHVGQVEGATDADALRAALTAPFPKGVAVDPARCYRVRCGGAAASAYGDELARTGASSSMGTDDAAVSAKAAKEKQEAIQQAARKVAEDALKGRLLEKSRLRKAKAASTAPGAGHGSPKGAPGVPKPPTFTPGKTYKMPQYPADPYGAPRKDTCPHPASSRMASRVHYDQSFLDFEVRCIACGKVYLTRVVSASVRAAQVYQAIEESAYRAGHRALDEDGLKNSAASHDQDPWTYLPGHIGGR